MSEKIDELMQKQRQLFNRVAIGMTAVACASGAYLANNPPSLEGDADCEATGTTVEYDLDDDVYQFCRGGKEVASIKTAGISAAVTATYGLTVAGAAIAMRPRRRDIDQTASEAEPFWPSAN